MSSANDVSVASPPPPESADAKRVRRLQRRCEKESARRASETMERWLSRRRIRDRGRRGAQSVEQRRREREKSRRASETAEQREQRLSRRIRDRARREAQSVEQRQILLQHRRERLNAESGEQRDVRLQQMRELTRERRAA